MQMKDKRGGIKSRFTQLNPVLAPWKSLVLAIVLISIGLISIVFGLGWNGLL